MDGGVWSPNSRNQYNLRDAVSRYTTQVYPKSWTAMYVALDNEVDLKSFRQWGSKTLRHPENFELKLSLALLVRGLPMLLDWHLLRSSWLRDLASLTTRLLSITRKMTIYANEVSVLMLGDEIPTFIAHPALHHAAQRGFYGLLISITLIYKNLAKLFFGFCGLDCCGMLAFVECT
ncbi:unnamed protein product [Lupinus luteus]|uniref:Plastocyanin-like domain-containing protein n=1 Tax=Lupinus luteus TaxID=3873 RepID=A0AAV1X752_LUPLU